MDLLEKFCFKASFILNAKQSHLLSLLAIAITLIAVFAYPYFPQRKMVIFPNTYTLASSHTVGTNTTARWLNKNYSVWECMLRTSTETPNCAIGISFPGHEEDWTQGIDLSLYERIEMKFDYIGNAQSMRLFARSFDPKISNPLDYNSAQFMQITLRKSDFDLPLVFELNEFKLADWWLNQYSVPRANAQPVFKRITTIGLDFAETSPIPLGHHRIEFDYFVLTGVYITRQNWFLGILLLWMLGITIKVLRQLNYFYQHSKRDKKRLNEMAKYTDELKKQSDLFQTQSKTDVLTNTLNRFGLQEKVSQLTDEHSGQEQIGVILLDIDHFKSVNDTYGHDVGDHVLSVIGQLLPKCIRSIDSVARWGGEEFVILCPQINATELIMLAEEIRQQVSELNFPTQKELSITASFGLTQLQPKESFDKVFKRADEALYQAKARGRNCCVANKLK